MKSVNIISIFMGISMFMFGFLKLFYPISEWFAIQISNIILGILIVYYFGLFSMNVFCG